MLISICQGLCHVMIVSWSHGFIGYAMSYNDSIIGFMVSMVSWVSGCQWFYGFIGFVVSWFHSLMCFVVS